MSKRKYNSDWENEEEFKVWITKDSSDVLQAFCKFCKISIRAHKNDLKRHAITPKHKNKLLELRNQKTLEYVVKNQNERSEAEIIFSVHIAVHSAIRNIDHVVNIFNGIKNQKIQLKLHRTKCSAIIKRVVAPVIMEELIKDIGNSFFSLIIDESTDISDQKHLCVCIKFYSKTKNDICTAFLSLVPVVRTTSEDLFQCLTEFMKTVNLDLKRLIGIGTDGASNLCGKNHSVYTLIKQSNPNALLIKCICHSLHLCASHASKVFKDDVDFILKETFNWFSKSPLRQEKYKEIWKIINVNENNKFLKLVQLNPTRWLAKYVAVERVLSQYLELETFFSMVACRERCYSATILSNLYKDKRNKLLLIFIKPIIKQIHSLNLYFQQDNVDFAKAIDEIIITVRCLARRVFKDSFISQCADIFAFKSGVNNANVQLHTNDVNYGEDFSKELKSSSLDENDVEELREKCKSFILILLDEVIKRLPPNLEIFEQINLFSPKIILNPLRSKFSELPPLFIEKEKLLEVESEYEKLLDMKWSNIFKKIPDNSLQFWREVSQIKNASGNFLFENISACALAYLAIPNSNATAERVFSIANSVKTKVRNRLSLESLNAVLHIKYYLIRENICCDKFVPSKKMLEKHSTTDLYKESQTEICTEENFGKDYIFDTVNGDEEEIIEI